MLNQETVGMVLGTAWVGTAYVMLVITLWRTHKANEPMPGFGIQLFLFIFLMVAVLYGPFEWMMDKATGTKRA